MYRIGLQSTSLISITSFGRFISVYKSPYARLCRCPTVLRSWLSWAGNLLAFGWNRCFHKKLVYPTKSFPDLSSVPRKPVIRDPSVKRLNNVRKSLLLPHSIKYQSTNFFSWKFFLLSLYSLLTALRYVLLPIWC